MRYIYPENTGVSPSLLPTSCTPEGLSEVLMKVAFILHSFSLKCSGFLFSILVFFHEQHLQFSGLQWKGKRNSLTPHYWGGVGAMGARFPSYDFFRPPPPPPIKSDVPLHGVHPHLKIKPLPSEKQHFRQHFKPPCSPHVLT